MEFSVRVGSNGVVLVGAACIADVVKTTAPSNATRRGNFMLGSQTKPPDGAKQKFQARESSVYTTRPGRERGYTDTDAVVSVVGAKKKPRLNNSAAGTT